MVSVGLSDCDMNGSTSLFYLFLSWCNISGACQGPKAWILMEPIYQIFVLAELFVSYLFCFKAC